MRSTRTPGIVATLLAAAIGCGPRGNGETPRPDGPTPDGGAPVRLGGTISFPGGDPMEFVVTLTGKPGGGHEGTFYYLVKEQLVITLDDLAYDDTTLRFSAIAPGQPEEARARFEVPLAGDPPWTGTLSQMGHDVGFALGPIPDRPQTPRPPFPYAERDLDFENPGDGTRLAGTLAIPEGAGPHPAIIMVTGSGAQNRDYAGFWHETFVVLSDHFARNGIAVLRFDDRGVGGSTGSLATATIEDLARDVVAGVEALARQPEIDPQRMGALGHSEGASIAAQASTLSDTIKFVVHLAGFGMSGGETMVVQEGLIFAAAGVPPEPITELQQVHRRLHELLLAPDTDPTALREAAREVVARQLAIGVDYLGAPAVEVTDEDVEQAVAVWTAPVVLELIAFDPSPILSNVHCPILVLNGTKDLQVPCERDLAEIGRMLREAGNENVTIQALEGLNHAFQPAGTGNIDEYERIETTFDPGALQLITDWIRGRVGLAP